MTDVLIRTKEQWEKYARAAQENKADRSADYFIEHRLVGDFTMWAIKKSTMHGMLGGFAAGLGAAAIIAALVKLWT